MILYIYKHHQCILYFNDKLSNSIIPMKLCQFIVVVIQLVSAMHCHIVIDRDRIISFFLNNSAEKYSVRSKTEKKNSEMFRSKKGRNKIFFIIFFSQF